LKGYIFFSVHEALFHELARDLKSRGVTELTGFCWSKQQEKTIIGRGVDYRDLVVFTRDMLPRYGECAPDLEWLAKRERELGVSIQRMIESERHLVDGRSFEQIMRMAEVALREIAAALDRTKPDFIFSEDVSCFHSYVHFVLARERGIKFWAIGTGRLPQRINVYSRAPQMAEQLEDRFRDLRERGLSTTQRALAEDYLAKFRDRPARPTGMDKRAKRPKLELADAGRIANASLRYFGDADDPTAVPPWRAIRTRVTRISRVAASDVLGVFEQPVAGEKYVLYPIHFQPEASTLVQAPMYLNQLELLRDIAASLPIGYRLYVKEHLSNRGRRPLSFYNQLRAIPSARLLGPDADTWSLIRNASAVAVITGTMGWEALMFECPVVTFGTVFFNHHPSVLRASEYPKDRWFEVFNTATSGQAVDREATLAMIVALHDSSVPGFIANPNVFPEVLEPENVKRLADALASAISLA
jgi:Capsule polysaccharide biosynthesis protein